MATTPRDATPQRVAVPAKDLFDQEQTAVPSPLTRPVATAPSADETFPPSGSIPIVPAPHSKDDAQRPPEPRDPIRALGDAAVAGAVSGRGVFSPSRNVSPPPGAPNARPEAAKPKTDPATGDVPTSPAKEADKDATSHAKHHGPQHTAQEDAGGGKPPKPPKRPAKDRDRPVPFFRRLGTLIVIGLLVSAGAVAYYAAYVAEAPVFNLAPRVVNIPLPTPAIDPIAIDSDSEFATGLPVATLDYALTSYEEMTLTQRFEWAGRAAEGWVLTYGDGAGGEMTVTAYQHYDVDAAIAAFEKVAPPSPDEVSATPGPDDPAAVPPVERQDVHVGDQVVGESVKTIIPAQAATETAPATPERAQIMWRNGTAVFIMVADPALIDDLFTEYGV